MNCFLFVNTITQLFNNYTWLNTPDDCYSHQPSWNLLESSQLPTAEVSVCWSGRAICSHSENIRMSKAYRTKSSINDFLNCYFFKCEWVCAGEWADNGGKRHSPVVGSSGVTVPTVNIRMQQQFLTVFRVTIQCIKQTLECLSKVPRPWRNNGREQ